MPLSEGIHILPLSGPKGTVHPVLIREGEDNLLIDAAFPGYWERLQDALEGAGVRPGGLRRLLFTHQDMDHIGCVNEIRGHSPGVCILAHRDEAPYIDGSQTPVKLAAMEAGADALPPERRAFLSDMKAAYANRAAPIGGKLGDGEILPLLGGVRVIHTPGHTPGHICLYLPAAGLLIAGDALNVREGALAGPAQMHTVDMPRALASLRKLAGLAVRRVVCYHGGLYDGAYEEALGAILRENEARTPAPV